MKYSYDDITFIIPVKIDCPIRLINLSYSLLYLSKTHNFKIIVKEVDFEKKAENIIKKIENPNINYVFEKQTDDCFHRTRYLNDMIEMCDTKIICNFDCDVLLLKNNIDKTLFFMENGADAVYPFGCGMNQLRIQGHEVLDESKPLLDNFNNFLNNFNSKNANVQRWSSLFGHCIMVKAEVYKKAFYENEMFKSYGPEDFDRYERFKKLGFSITHLNYNEDGDYILHLEHPRGNDSSDKNKYFKINEELRDSLQKMSKEELIKTYNEYEYVKKRNLVQ